MNRPSQPCGSRASRVTAGLLSRIPVASRAGQSFRALPTLMFAWLPSSGSLKVRRSGPYVAAVASASGVANASLQIIGTNRTPRGTRKLGWGCQL